MDYKPPIDEMAFLLRHVGGLDKLLGQGAFADADWDMAQSILEEAGRLASEVLAPLNRPADVEGVHFDGRAVTMPAGMVKFYRTWREGGWNAVALPAEWGGMGLPALLNTATLEMWTSACMALALAPPVTQGAAEVLIRHGSDALRAGYLTQLVSGEWVATMCLTEPQAGSDLGTVATLASPAADGAWRINGAKIFITYGDHDLSDNIVHMVLARTPDAPTGSRGLSLFLVPKVLPDGTRNGAYVTGVEHKLGLHASPTCSMSFEDASGWLVGEVNHGLAGMFTIMNRARLGTGLQGVAIAERAYQQALAFARSRKQGKAGGTGFIVEHPDVRRMLLTMKALTLSGRALAYAAARAIDQAEAADDGARRAAGEARAALLTPMVKAYCSDLGFEVASLGVQVHGGMGFVEETGAAQYLRDVRVTQIYEGANGIQAIDLVGRKVRRDGGAEASRAILDFKAVAAHARELGQPAVVEIGERLDQALGRLESATAWMLDPARSEEAVLAVASPYLRLFSLTAAGAYLGQAAVAAAVPADADGVEEAIIAAARFFAQTLLAETSALADTVIASGPSVLEGAAALR